MFLLILQTNYVINIFGGMNNHRNQLDPVVEALHHLVRGLGLTPIDLQILEFLAILISKLEKKLDLKKINIRKKIKLAIHVI